jgi:CDP-diacylglycerol--glycerol-3-phosphate 3-phosphatidyltransferase
MNGPSKQIVNVPNMVTASRLILAIVVFVLVPWRWYWPAFVVFVLAASTDWVDGFWARRYNQVTQLGRVFDPFVDKIIVCGMFIFLAAESHHGSGIAPWMAVVVVGREMLVTALRSAIEQGGGDFSAKMSGKLKMVFQCIAVGASLVALTYDAPDLPPAWIQWTLCTAVWLAVLTTVWSGVQYVFAGARFLFG